jgi:hypothetical protein
VKRHGIIICFYPGLFENPRYLFLKDKLKISDEKGTRTADSLFVWAWSTYGRLEYARWSGGKPCMELASLGARDGRRYWLTRKSGIANGPG